MRYKNVFLKTFCAIGMGVLLGCAPHLGGDYDYSKMEKNTREVHRRAEELLQRCIKTGSPLDLSPQVRIDSVQVNFLKQTIDIYFNEFFSYPAFRPLNVENTYRLMRDLLESKYKDYGLTLYSLTVPVEQMVPNLFRQDKMPIDTSRLPLSESRDIVPLLRCPSRPFSISQGLQGRHIALWPSHGWYYSHDNDRWEWQRPRLFQTVEDLLPLSFVLPYLTPMLEKAGATVLLPRERDWQTQRVIVDNDPYEDESKSVYDEPSGRWLNGLEPGFAVGDLPYRATENPFRQGSYRFAMIDSQHSPQAEWIPTIPAAGLYGVFVSYPALDANINDAEYTVYHRGGQTCFHVNQQMGGSTWLFLGRFRFPQGRHPDSAKVVLRPGSPKSGRLLAADAVRFGGGMGMVARGGRTSGRPCFVEAARYYLQTSGMPDSLVWDLDDGQSDYRDDYQSRGEWVNYLHGAPAGPNKDRTAAGKGIPIDLSLGIHTDAGITRNDTTVGTLAIYSLEGADSTFYFPDGQYRMANRDFADIVQTELVRDVQSLYDSTWNRRQLMDGKYSEAYRPNVPSLLLEMFSHQNYLDMKFALDPRFRFDVSRAIYKAILKFLSFQHQQEYTVQPLPVDHFRARFNKDGDVVLSWKPQSDPLAPSAVPEGYVVYTRINDSGFDNGRRVHKARAIMTDITPGAIYSFRVTAINKGGQSFPSETLAACRFDNNPDVLIVNGFDRVAAPRHIETDRVMGFIDRGVAAYWNVGFTGRQWNFDPESEFTSNDAPGHGASYGNYETRVMAGNQFDYPFVHGQALEANRVGFVSMSDECFMKMDSVELDYSFVDLILGKERATLVRNRHNDSTEFNAFPPEMLKRLDWLLQQETDLFISGAYVGSELFGEPLESQSVQFAESRLKIQWTTENAAKRGKVFSVDPQFMSIGTEIEYNAGQQLHLYAVEHPDAIEPAKKSAAKALLRFAENEFGAAVGYQGKYDVVIFSFPFESISDQNMRNQIMSAVLKFSRKR